MRGTMRSRNRILAASLTVLVGTVLAVSAIRAEREVRSEPARVASFPMAPPVPIDPCATGACW